MCAERTPLHRGCGGAGALPGPARPRTTATQDEAGQAILGGCGVGGWLQEQGGMRAWSRRGSCLPGLVCRVQGLLLAAPTRGLWPGSLHTLLCAPLAPRRTPPGPSPSGATGLGRASHARPPGRCSQPGRPEAAPAAIAMETVGLRCNEAAPEPLVLAL